MNNDKNISQVLLTKADPKNNYPLFVYPSPRLREKAIEVTDFGQDLQTKIDKMINTMYAAGGVGLAAPQVGLPIRMFIIDTLDKGGALKVFVNPVITASSQKLVAGFEGCLSFPGVGEEIQRAEWISGTAQDRNGNIFNFSSGDGPQDTDPNTITLDSVEVVAVQHELDHLNGVLVIDKVSRIKQRFMTKTVNNTMKRIRG
jgi:peptide deformylase